jgi:hypothetical protein
MFLACERPEFKPTIVKKKIDRQEYQHFLLLVRYIDWSHAHRGSWGSIYTSLLPGRTSEYLGIAFCIILSAIALKHNAY